MIAFPPMTGPAFSPRDLVRLERALRVLLHPTADSPYGWLEDVSDVVGDLAGDAVRRGRPPDGGGDAAHGVAPARRAAARALPRPLLRARLRHAPPHRARGAGRPRVRRHHARGAAPLRGLQRLRDGERGTRPDHHADGAGPGIGARVGRVRSRGGRRRARDHVGAAARGGPRVRRRRGRVEAGRPGARGHGSTAGRDARGGGRVRHVGARGPRQPAARRAAREPGGRDAARRRGVVRAHALGPRPERRAPRAARTHRSTRPRVRARARSRRRPAASACAAAPRPRGCWAGRRTCWCRSSR